MTAEELAAVQAAVRAAGVDGWLLYDFRRSNPIALHVLGLPTNAFFSRRWMYYVPAQGEPSALVSAVEAHTLASMPGTRRVYRTWREYQALLAEMLGGARRVAMEYSPANAIPYVARVDAGTVELVRSLGVEVVSSADFAQQFEATLSAEQIESHRAAGRALLRARDELLVWLRGQVMAGAALSEYGVQGMFTQMMRGAGLYVAEGEEPLVAVNGNAANPHYSPSAARHAEVRRGDLLLLDFSAPLVGVGRIFADYTWMVWVGERTPERVEALFGVIRDAREAGIALLRTRFEAGEQVEGREVDAVVRAVVAGAGYGEAFVHRTGHNIGEHVHGNGANLDDFETYDTRPLLARSCVSVEPGIYLPEEGLGLRTEVDVLLLEGEIEVTGTPAQMEVTALLA